MKCNEFKENINQYIYDELSLDIKNKMQNHMSKCVTCRELLREEEEMNVHFDMAVNNIEIDLTDKIINNIDKNKYKQKEERHNNEKKYLALVASLVIVVGVGQGMLLNPSNIQKVEDTALLDIDEAPKVEPANMSVDKVQSNFIIELIEREEGIVGYILDIPGVGQEEVNLQEIAIIESINEDEEEILLEIELLVNGEPEEVLREKIKSEIYYNEISIISIDNKSYIKIAK